MKLILDINTVTLFISLMGSVQGFILFILTFRNRKYKSNLFLSWFILLLTGNILLNSLFDGKIYLEYPWLLMTSFIPYLYGPLIYFYIHYSFYRNFSTRISFAAHCIPAGLNLILYLAIFLLTDGDTIMAFIEQVYAGQPPLFVSIIELGKMVSGVVYSGLIIRLILEYRKNIRAWFKNKTQKKWLMALAFVFVFCWSIVIVNFTMLSFGKFTFGNFNLLYALQTISFVLAMYVIAFFALRYPALFSEDQVRDKIRSKLNLSEQEINRLKARLTRLMENKKVYLDDALSLYSLARKMEVHANVLSFLVNESFQKNFNEYINDYRLDHFVELMKVDKETTVLRLAFDSGFASKSVFNKVFKEKYKMSPIEYRNLNA